MLEEGRVCHVGGGGGEEDICSGYVIWSTPTLTATSSRQAPPSWTISLSVFSLKRFSG